MWSAKMIFTAMNISGKYQNKRAGHVVQFENDVVGCGTGLVIVCYFCSSKELTNLLLSSLLSITIEHCANGSGKKLSSPTYLPRARRR